MKKLVIDARMVGEFGHGISRYVEGIAAHLNVGNPLTDELLSLLGVRSLQDLEIVFLVRPDFPKTSPIRSHQTQVLDLSSFDPRSWIEIPYLLKKLKADLYFNPTFSSFPALPCDYVQTVHDLNHLYYGGLSQKLYYEFLLKRSMKRAKRIFTVSNAIRDDLVKWAAIDSSRISVHYNQFERSQRQEADAVKRVLDRYRLKSREFFLCVTNSKPHKNLSFLVDAYLVYRGLKKTKEEKLKKWSDQFLQNQNLLKMNHHLPLVTTITQDDLETQTNGSGLVLAIGNVDDETLAVLYQECGGFYFPSLYEGFGRPPVEAALAGAPMVVVSDIPVHHEAESLANSKFNFLGV